MVACISEFSKQKNLSQKQAFFYLYEHKAMEFLDEFYDVEHTLSFAEVIDDLTKISQQNGGKIQ